MLNRNLSWKESIIIAAVTGVVVALWASPTSVGPCGSRQMTCLNNLNQIGKAVELYSAEWDDRRLPPIALATCLRTTI